MPMAELGGTNWFARILHKRMKSDIWKMRRLPANGTFAWFLSSKKCLYQGMRYENARKWTNQIGFLDHVYAPEGYAR